jgi:hypothetical protein
MVVQFSVEVNRKDEPSLLRGFLPSSKPAEMRAFYSGANTPMHPSTFSPTVSSRTSTPSRRAYPTGPTTPRSSRFIPSRKKAGSGSPGEFVTLEKKVIIGDPDMKRACTSHVERQNGTLRQWCKRLTRLTYAFSKKWENLQAALALHFAYYNFCRVHGALRVTPAMEAGITNRVWGMADLVA